MSEQTDALERAIVDAQADGDWRHAAMLERELRIRRQQERERAAGLDPFRYWRER